MRRAAWALGFSALVVAAFTALTGGVFCGATLHVPRRVGPMPPAAETVAIAASDGARLSAWWMRPATANGNCVAVLHGIGDSRVGSVGFAPLFLNAGYSVLLPDSRAHGASEGRFVTYGLFEKYDALAWVDWMRRAGCGKVYGLGESLGAAVLIQAAAVRPAFSAIVAECAFADLREAAVDRARGLAGPAAGLVVGAGMLYARFVDGLDFREVSPVRSIAVARTPILLIHGLDDFRTPPSNSERLAAANRSDPLWLVPHALHTGAAAAAPEEFRARVLAWFARH